MTTNHDPALCYLCARGDRAHDHVSAWEDQQPLTTLAAILDLPTRAEYAASWQQEPDDAPHENAVGAMAPGTYSFRGWK